MKKQTTNGCVSMNHLKNLPSFGIDAPVDSQNSELDSTTSKLLEMDGFGCEFGINSVYRFRKFSAPVTLSRDYLGLPNLEEKSKSRSGSPSRRRFSNVSDVTRKISTTIGWRTVDVGEVIAQAKCIGSQYIRSRLKKAGLLNKKLGLQRLRSAANLSGGWEVYEVFPRVSLIGQELERSAPKVYGSVAKQLSISLTSDKVVRSVVGSVAGQVFRTQVTWGRIISVLAVTAGLASDCVRQGHPEYVGGLIEAIGVVTEKHTAAWIASQGGWSALLTWSQTSETDPSVLILGVQVAGLVLFTVALIVVLRYLGHLLS